MLSDLRRVLDYEMTVAEWIGTALLAGLPYVAIGVVWSLTHTVRPRRPRRTREGDRVSRAIVTWPVLLVADVLHAMTDNRIRITRRTARWSDEPVTAADAMDFWSFAAGAANVIMQLSRPGVGHGVVESKVDSGALMKHPWKRARTTFQYLAVAVIGTDEDRAAFREAVNEAHRQVKSGPYSPVQYNAFDRDLQMWVAACLFVGLEDTYQLLRGEMTPRAVRAVLHLGAAAGNHAAGQ